MEKESSGGIHCNNNQNDKEGKEVEMEIGEDKNRTCAEI